MSDLVNSRDIPITRICGERDAAVEKLREAAAMIRRGHELAQEAREQAQRAAGGSVFSLVDRSHDASFRRLFESFDAAASADSFRKHTDACVWVHLMKVTGLERLMDATAREQFFKELSTSVPEVNEQNLWATLEGLRGDAELIFQRGLARAFADLDKRFKSHDAFKIGARMILTNVFNEFGSWNYYGKSRAMVSDVERVLAVLDGQTPQPGELEAEIDRSRKGMGRQQGVCETRYLRIRTFMNGNAHLWFTRDDLVTKANKVLADYYGAVLPDAVPRDDDALRTRAGLPALDLGFYPSPPAVVDALLADLNLERTARILEPSAGRGAIVHGLRAKGFTEIDAIEIDPRHVAHLRLCAIRGLDVQPGNFLLMPARAEYDAVVMNPPFYGTHWMEHVVHAFDWLKPDGVLRAILPVTAEVGESAKHEAFRAWASKRTRWGRGVRFQALPPESFVASGTRINTVILELHRER